MWDTHCHLSFSQYDADRDYVLQKAGIVGVGTIINPGTDLAQSRAAVAMAEKYENVWAGVGVHPQDIGGLTDGAFDEIAKLARHPRVVAIGEVGLELHHRAGDLEPQKEWLARFLDLADEVGKPLIFHVRNAHAEMRHVLDTPWPTPRSSAKAERRGARAVVHCFSGTADDARFYTSRGLLLGITGIVTYASAGDLQTIVQDVPLEHLLLETDSPFLAPQSHRGKRNEPAYVREVAEEIARLKGVSLRQVEEQTDENARRLFGI